MKKMFRGLLCVAALAMLLCTSAFAAESDINIQLNGVPVSFTDAAPQIQNDRTYLPFRAVFTALGFADDAITYDGETKTVAAASEELTVSMVIGENKLTVSKDGETTVIDTDVPAFIDPELGRTYVPVGFVAQAVGYRVGWDGANRTVILDDVDGILAANQETYEVLDMYLDYSRKFQEKNYKVKGAYAADMDLMGEVMEMSGTYDMLMAGNTKFDFEMDMQIAGMVEGEDLSAAIPEGIDLEMRGDMEQGQFYFKSDALMSMMETGLENLWFKIDLAALMDAMAAETGMGYAELMAMSKDMMAGMDGKALIDYLVRMTADLDSTTSVVDFLALYNTLLGDSAFVKDGSDYVNSMEIDGAELAFVFQTSGGKVNGYQMAVSVVDEEMGVYFEMVIAMEKDEMMAALTMDIGGAIVMVLEMDGEYTATSQKPAGAPGKDAAVMDLMEAMGEIGEELPAPEPAA